jgi:RimJ/RimL family protein N-acetyltransferase
MRTRLDTTSAAASDPQTVGALHEAVQRRLLDRRDEIAANPILANGGRLLNILDPDEYGWEEVRREAERDRFLALTVVPREATLARIADLFGAELEPPYWQAFFGPADDILSACAALLAAAPLPDGWTVVSDRSPGHSVIGEVQSLNAATGVAPSPAWYMRGEAVPHLTTCIRDATGTLVASGAATDRYHPASPLGGTVFAGSVSVAPDHRRRGLGVFVCARLLTDSHDAFGWRHVLAQAKADNAASCGMLRRCGLIPDPDLVTIVINLSGGYVTR